MIESLRRLRREIDSLTSALRADKHVFVTSPEMLERVQQVYLTWSTSLRPNLVVAGVPKEVLSRPDGSLYTLVRLTGHRSQKRRYLQGLTRLRRALVEQVLLEVAKVSTPGTTGFRPQSARMIDATERLLPEIPDVGNELLPNALFGSVEMMRAFLRQHSFERNVFLMVPYRKRLSSLISAVKNVMQEFGLDTIVARDHRLTDDLYNPIACLLCCSYGIAIFDRPEPGQKHNSNIVYELAMMQLLKRRCLILKHRSVKNLPSDFLHRLYENYKDETEAVKQIREWWGRLNLK